MRRDGFGPSSCWTAYAAKMRRVILTSIPLHTSPPHCQAAESQAEDFFWQNDGGRSLRFFSHKWYWCREAHWSSLLSPPCRVWCAKCNDCPLGGAHCQITLYLLPSTSLLLHSPLSSVSSSCSWIPGLFSPSLVLSFLMSFHIQIALLAGFFFCVFLTKEQLRELALTGVHGNNPRQLTNPFNPHQVIPWTAPDPF